MNEHVAWGLRILSESPLSELRGTGPVADSIPVTVRFGPVTAPPDDARVAGPTMRAKGGAVWMRVSGVAACQVNDGQDIRIELHRDVDAADALAALSGPLFAIVLHQRGFLPLHASAVEAEGGGAAFVGRSCVGKSAIAAVLQGRGRRLVADDLVAVDTRNDSPVLWPGPPAVHLWPDVMEALDIEETRGRPIRAGVDKRTIEVRSIDEPLVVRHVTVIDTRSAGDDVDRRSGFDALSVLVASSWHASALEAMQIRAAHFERCAQVARSAAIWRWPRPDGVGRMAGSLAGLEAAWRVATERLHT
jgi:hypothetical protein